MRHKQGFASGCENPWKEEKKTYTNKYIIKKVIGKPYLPVTLLNQSRAAKDLTHTRIVNRNENLACYTLLYTNALLLEGYKHLMIYLSCLGKEIIYQLWICNIQVSTRRSVEKLSETISWIVYNYKLHLIYVDDFATYFVTFYRYN